MSNPLEQPAAESVLTVELAKPDPPSEERITSLDLVRGIAILGILPVNMAFLMAPIEGMMPRPPVQWWGDPVVAGGVLFFFTGKMITQLAILFGAGLALQSDRAEATGQRFAGYYAWRMILLLLIGLAHALLLWYGDILASYALIGLGALVLRRLSQRALLWCVAGFLTWHYVLITGMAVLIPVFAAGAQGQNPEATTSGLTYYMSASGQLRIYQQGPWLDMVIHRALWLGMYFILFAIWLFWQLLACFLVGVYLIRRGVFQDVAAHRDFLLRLVLFGLGVGIPLHVTAVVLYLINPQNPLAGLLNSAGAVPQALAYLGLTLFWSQSTFAPRLQERLRAVGRMALTNYLMQSVICTTLFYAYGLALFGQHGYTFGLAVFIGIWLLELAWSPVWLRHFTMGPVEWLWRSLADRKVRPFRRPVVA